jgi:hypothetical protein
MKMGLGTFDKRLRGKYDFRLKDVIGEFLRQLIHLCSIIGWRMNVWFPN